MRIQTKPAASGFYPQQVIHLHRFSKWCGVLLLCVYFFRGSVLPWFLPVPASGWTIINALALLLVAGYSAAGGGSWRLSWGLVLVAFAVSIFPAEQLGGTAFRWAGLALLILAVGPVIMNPAAVALRSSTWQLTIKGITTLTAIFTLWYALHLPSFRAKGGCFNGFMNQSMLLGPIAGMGVAIASTRALHGRSWRWGLLALIGVVPLLASGSRIAVLAAVVAISFLLLRHKPLLGLLCGFLFALAIYGFMNHAASPKTSDSSMVALANKGTKNSRASLWNDRMTDFKLSPIVGVGLGMGTDSRYSGSEAGIAGVEPGSSYLGILSMTGVLGTTVFLTALGMLLFRFLGSQSQGNMDRDILYVVGIYLAVHGLAEGWVLAFGSPLGFVFWLWLGNVGDSAGQPIRRLANRKLRPPVKVRAVQPASATT